MAIGMICGTFWLRRGVGGNESRCSITTAPGADLNNLHWRVINRYIIVSKHMKEVCIEIVLHKNTIQFFTTDWYDAGILSWVHSWGSVRGATKRWCQDHAGFKEQSFEDSKEGHESSGAKINHSYLSLDDSSLYMLFIYYLHTFAELYVKRLNWVSCTLRDVRCKFSWLLLLLTRSKECDAMAFSHGGLASQLLPSGNGSNKPFKCSPAVEGTSTTKSWECCGCGIFPRSWNFQSHSGWRIKNT